MSSSPGSRSRSRSTTNPSKISGEVDKRQQIAEPIAPENQPNGDGKNRAETTVSQDGSFSYTVDIRNTSSTWVDEFTVEDALQGASEAPFITRLHYDARRSWRRTPTACSISGTAQNKPSGQARDEANATLDDGHDNPWLRDESTAPQLGGDGLHRRLRWMAALANGSRRLEGAAPRRRGPIAPRRGGSRRNQAQYGRVEKGFASRSDEWGRRDLKHEHDDFEGTRRLRVIRRRSSSTCMRLKRTASSRRCRTTSKSTSRETGGNAFRTGMMTTSSRHPWVPSFHRRESTCPGTLRARRQPAPLQDAPSGLKGGRR